MKKTYKWILSLIVAFSLLFPGFSSFVFADWANAVYEETEEAYIAKGVKHTHMLKFTDQGWLNIHVLRVDLTERSNALELLYHQNGLGNKAKLSAFVQQNEKIVGAINGDFFNMTSAETLGPMVKDGELLSTPFYLPDKMAAFNISKEGIPFIEYWTSPQLDLTNKTRPAMLKFMAVNKNSGSKDTAILFNKAWGEKTPAVSKNISNAIEMIVENNQIQDILPAKEGSVIPEEGFVIWASGSFAAHIQQYFVVGDEVELTINTMPDFQQLALTLGGGAVIVKNGAVPAAFTHEIKGKHPRTAIGISKDKNEIIFATIDGRTSSYTGVSQKELGEIMVSLGAYEAINLDGGGSTEMILRPQGETRRQIVNHPSGGTERNLMNGIGVVNTAPKSDTVKGIKLETIDTNIFVNTSRQFTIKAYDENYHPMEIDDDEVKWYVTGVKGDFDGNVFKPSSVGKGMIAAEYKGAYAAMAIRVLDNPTALTLSPSKLILGISGKKALQAAAVNHEGYRAVLDLQDLHLDVPKNLGTIDSNGTFTAADHSTSGIIKASFDQLTYHLPVAVGYQQKLLDDFERPNAAFLAYPAEVTGDYALAPISKSGQYSGKLSFDFTTTDATRAAYMVLADGGLVFDQRPSKLGMWVYGSEVGGHWLRAKIVGGDGIPYNLDLCSSVDWSGWKYVEASVPINIKGPLKLERIYVVETDAALKNKGSIYIDDLTAFYPIELPEAPPNQEVTLKDARETKAELKGDKAFRFFAYGKVDFIDTLADRLIINKMADIANASAIRVFTESLEPKLKEKLHHETILADGGYAAVKHQDSLFVKLDNTKGGLRETNFAQWAWWIDTVEHTRANSVFVVLPKPLSFNDKLEEKLFKDLLQKLKEEKKADVWVLTGGKDTCEVTIENGIRYVSLPSYPENDKIDIFTQLKYMLFTVNDDQVTYEILPMYEK